ncbi:hypothetical protein AGMMS50233_09190 [Endomicrobiia bacterium]|nr:hypothetical protein AGMMS50233_09190 [Endomicrobiia bacterium]
MINAQVVLSDEQKPYQLTDKQLEVLRMISDAPATYVDETGQTVQHKALEVLLYGGARSAKTFLNCFIVIARACKERSRHIILRESFTSVDRSILHDTWPKVLVTCFPELIDRIKKRVKPPFYTFPNGSEVWFGGLEDNDKVLGNEFSTALISEASEVVMFSNYIKVLTRLAQKNGLRKLMLVDENPPSKIHWTYKRFIEHRDPTSGEKLDDLTIDTLRAMQLNPADNLQNIDPGHLATLASGSERDRNRFFFGIFLDTVEGGVYTKELNAAEMEHRICEVKHNPDYPVNVVFDIGVSDYTSIWFCQFLPDRVLLLDYYQNNHMSLPDYIDVIFKKYGQIGTMILPHDVLPKSWSTGRSHFEVAYEHGKKLHFTVRVLYKVLALQDGIDSTRLLFKNMWFDSTKCADGLDVLRNYRYDYKESLDLYKDKPLHDKYSHGADALRYVSDAYNGKYVNVPVKKEPEKSNWTFKDLLDENIAV